MLQLTTILTQTGPLVGRVVDGVADFRGVPYAAPPVGPLRWRPPQPPAPWIEPRDAASFGPICLQPLADGDHGVGPGPMSEDCLTLNVWAPQAIARPLPVMVWIHGGGFTTGSGSAPLYDGANLARRDVVLVTLNYRLGRLGFFDHPALAAERGADGAGGNYGLMDIMAALSWVRDNIAAFGGDPGRVTIFGQSAGGAAVLRLMTSPPAQGLFHRATVQSGLGREQDARLDRSGPGGQPSAQDRGLAFGAAKGLGPDATAAQLRALEPQTLLTPAPSFYGDDLSLIDGRIVTESVVEAFAAGHQAQIPLLIGSNSGEFQSIKPDAVPTHVAFDAALTDEHRAELIAAYGGQRGYDAHILDDLIFAEPPRHLARLHSRTGQPTWLYRFDVPGPTGTVTHGAERAAVFDNPTPSQAADAMAAYWTRFAATGDPNGPDAPAWPAASEGDTHLLAFTPAGPVAEPVPHGARLGLIERFQARSAAN